MAEVVPAEGEADAGRELEVAGEAGVGGQALDLSQHSPALHLPVAVQGTLLLALGGQVGVGLPGQAQQASRQHCTQHQVCWVDLFVQILTLFHKPLSLQLTAPETDEVEVRHFCVFEPAQLSDSSSFLAPNSCNHNFIWAARHHNKVLPNFCF